METVERQKKLNVLFIFGGEKAQGAEMVIERLMNQYQYNINTHLILSPGKFADELLAGSKPYRITTVDDLKKLNRSSVSKWKFYTRALKNYFTISHKVYRYIKEYQIDVVHSNTLIPASYIIPLIVYSRLFSLKTKWLWSDHDLKYFSGVDQMFSKICVKLYDVTLVVSEALKRKYIPNNLKVKVMYNGLDNNYFRPNEHSRVQMRMEWGFTEQQIVIGIAGSINPDKGQFELVKIFNRLTLKFPQIYLVIAGNYASHFPEHAKLIKQEILHSERVDYVGFIHDTRAFYNGCDIIINNSNNARSESLGTTIYEAMACETIVIAANTGGTPEIIEDNVDGFLFEADNSEELYNKLNDVISNFSLMENIKRAAREKTIRKFNIINMARQYGDILNRYQN